MTLDVNWDGVAAGLPGVYLSGQYPAGAGIAVSVELTHDGWILHAAREAGGGRVERESTPPLGALELYRRLGAWFAELGEAPEIGEAERDALDLPPMEDLYEEHIRGLMPGHWLGAAEEGETEFGWRAHHSVTEDAPGRFTLHASLASGEDDPFPERPEMDAAGPLDLAGLLDELRLLGFGPEAAEPFLRLPAGDAERAKALMPGAWHGPAGFGETGVCFSILPAGPDEWRLFYTEAAGDGLRVRDAGGMDARRVHKTVYGLTGGAVPGETARAAKLPPLDRLHREALEKKLKAEWISAPGLDAEGRGHERYLVFEPASGEFWRMQYVLSEDILAMGPGNRKFPVHEWGPGPAEALADRLMEMDPFIDPLECYFAMRDRGGEDLAELAEAFRGRLEG